MNQRGFIPIIIIVVGAAAVASAVFGVIKYKDEIITNISEVFIGPKIEAPNLDSTAGDEVIEELELVEEPIVEEPVVAEAPIITPSVESIEPIIEVEEVEEPEEISEPEEIEEIEIIEEIEEVEEEIEEVEEPEVSALTISDIDVDVSRNPANITWIANRKSEGLMEYGLVADVYNSDSILSNTMAADNGFLHTVYLFVEDNTIYHYRVVSIDSDGNRMESEDRTFIKNVYFFPASLYPSGTPLSYRDTTPPTTEIWITNYSPPQDSDFTVNWSSSESNCTFEVRYQFKAEKGWGQPIDLELSDTSQTSIDFTALEDGKYRFQAKATDSAENEGDWSNWSEEVKVDVE